MVLNLVYTVFSLMVLSVRTYSTTDQDTKGHTAPIILEKVDIGPTIRENKQKRIAKARPTTIKAPTE